MDTILAHMRTARANAYTRLESLPNPSHAYGIAIAASPPVDFYDAPVLRASGLEIKTIGDVHKHTEIFASHALHIAEEAFPTEEKSIMAHVSRADGLVLVRVPALQDLKRLDISRAVKGFQSPHVVIVAEQKSRAHVLFQLPVFTRTCAVELLLEDGAELTVEPGISLEGDALCMVAAKIGKNANLVMKDSIETHAFLKMRFAALLAGGGALVTDKSRYRGLGSAVLDMERNIFHAGVATISRLQARGVVFDKARAVWRGRVRVVQNAWHADAFQKHDALLMSAQAEVDASPVLEIYTNDISCRHSASVQRVNPESLFYLMSRGMSESEARGHIAEGFLRAYSTSNA